MLIAFILGMPNNNSRNGKWSGASNVYAVVKSLHDTKRNAARHERILLQRNFSYDFGDGWRASVEVKLVTPSEARKLRKESQGFCGYEWMIETILAHGEIRAEIRDESGRRGYSTSGRGEVIWYDRPAQSVEPLMAVATH